MHILLVDDHQLFSAGLSLLLRELSPDVEITVANTVAKALEISGNLELILLDLHLPDVQGFNGLTHLKSQFEAIPIVVLSSEENPVRIRECIEQGAMGFVPKSSTPAELFNAMQLILKGSTYLPRNCLAPLNSKDLEKIGAIQFSPRQHQVLQKVIQGKPNKVIAREMGISDQTVKSHVMAVMAALQVGNRTEAVYRAAALGIS